MKLLLLIATLITFLLAAESQAGKPQPQYGLMLQADSFSNPNPNYPPSQPGCYHEDVHHWRYWTGMLAPGASFTVSLRFCSYYNPDTGETCDAPSATCPFGGPGSEGVSYTLAVDKPNFDYAMSITHPDGTVQQARLVQDDRDRLQLGGCVVPPFYISTGNGTDPIQSGIYTVTLRNISTNLVKRATDIGFEIDVQQAFVWWQQQKCPIEDQRLLP